MKKFSFFAAALAALTFSACSSDSENENQVVIDPVTPVSYEATSAVAYVAPEAGRILATRGDTKADKVALDFALVSPSAATDAQLSATAIQIVGTKAYITWHSNLAAGATQWGGLIDVVDLSTNELLGSISSAELKFNNILVSGAQVFGAATSNKIGGAVARFALEDGKIPAGITEVDRIGFPGGSVNALAEYADGTLIGISGHDLGTYATFAKTVAARPYIYLDQYTTDSYENEVCAPEWLSYGVNNNFGGKYVALDESGDAYILYNTAAAKIAKVNKADLSKTDVVSTDVQLKADNAAFGKHVLAVKGGKAYFAAGQNGLQVYDLATGEKVAERNINVAGVCVSGDKVYAAASNGLWVLNDDAELSTYAFEGVYDADGNATKTGIAEDAELNRPEYNSVNFVTVADGKIYVAYGQAGVKVWTLK